MPPFPLDYYINQKEETLIYPCSPEQAYHNWCDIPIKKIYGEGRLYTILNKNGEVWIIYLDEENKWIVDYYDTIEKNDGYYHNLIKEIENNLNELKEYLKNNDC